MANIDTLVKELGQLTVLEALELSKKLSKEWDIDLDSLQATPAQAPAVATESTTATVIEDHEIVQSTKVILEEFHIRGPVTLQFIRKDKELFLLELNPRFGGGVIASIESGFEIPRIMIMDYLDIPFKKLTNYKTLIMTRCYREAFHAANN